MKTCGDDTARKKIIQGGERGVDSATNFHFSTNHQKNHKDYDKQMFLFARGVCFDIIQHQYWLSVCHKSKECFWL